MLDPHSAVAGLGASVVILLSPPPDAPMQAASTLGMGREFRLVAVLRRLRASSGSSLVSLRHGSRSFVRAPLPGSVQTFHGAPSERIVVAPLFTLIADWRPTWHPGTVV